ncbi:MAG: sodium:calcium antiporter [Chloroflexi bacterium]|nr:sodium:calcium antiporter [Chloroflexota bacterium]
MALRVDSVSPEMEALIFGAGIVAAAFLLTWAAEVAEMDISQALALAFVALITVLPEYAVDLYFSWQAGQELRTGVSPDQMRYVHFATANMTGANRLLVGLGWPVVAFLFWFRSRRAVSLEPGIRLELLALLLPTLYAFTIPFKGNIALWDGGLLVLVFVVYLWLSSHAAKVEPELIGPPKLLAKFSPSRRRLTVVALFLFSAGVILSAAEPFAEGLLAVGRTLQVNEFIMVQWIAPLASETPEMLVAVIFTIRGQATAAMTALISAKVNQWSFLVGTLPFAFSVSAGAPHGLPLDARQAEEIWLTAAQSLLALVLLARLRVGWLTGATLFLLWGTQLFLTSAVARFVYIMLYLGVAAFTLVADPGRIKLLGGMFPAAAATIRGNFKGGVKVGGK